MANLLVEVDEALKQERLERLWKQYGGFFIGLITAIILGTAANAGYHYYTEKKSTEQTQAYLSHTDNKDISPAELITLAESLDAQFASLTRFNAAGLALEKGDQPLAVDIYKQLENDTTAPQAIRYAAYYMHTNTTQNLSADEKLARFQTILDQKSNPWLYHAHLESALILANEKKDFTAARMHLEKLMTDTNAIPSIQKKAQSLDVVYRLKEKL